MRNPNGYGSVVYLGKHRRQPYAIRKTVNWELENGTVKQKYQYVEYFATHEEALIKLAEINKRKLDVSKMDVTFADLYAEWYDKHTAKKSKQSKTALKCAYKYCMAVADYKVTTISEDALQTLLDKCDKGYCTRSTVKQVMQGVMEYAVSKGIRGDNPSAMLDCGKPSKSTSHKVIENVASLNVDNSIMLMLYTGIRIEELLTTRLDNIHLDERYFVTGVKTDAGKDRKVPIHKAVVPFIQNAIDNNKEYLYERKGRQCSYCTYRNNVWDKEMPRYTPHDTRHTFVSAMQKLGVPKRALQLIVGHKGDDVTDDVYTHYSIDELIAFIDLLKY